MRRSALALVALGLCGATATAAAQQVVLQQRVDVQPTFFGLARVRVVASVFSRAGEVIVDIKPDELVLAAGGRALKAVAGVQRDLTPADVVFVVQVTQSFGEALPQLDDPMSALFKELGRTLPGSRVALVTFGGDEPQAKPFTAPAAAARGWSRRVVAEIGPAAPLLVEAVDQARKLFRDSQTTRRLMVVIADGREAFVEGMDRDDLARGSKLPKALADDGIVVDTIAFDPSGRRGFYLLNLGQLSRLTNGFPRLVTDAELLAGAIKHLQAELTGQVVLTYLVPLADVTGAKLQVLCKSPQCGWEKGEKPLESNALRALPACGGKGCRDVCVEDRCLTLGGGNPSTFPWWAIGLGAGAAVAVAVGLVLLRRRPRAAAPPPQVAPVVAPVVAPPPPPPKQNAWLFVLGGPLASQRFQLHHGFTIGAAPGVDLAVVDAAPHHAQLRFDVAGGASVVDLGSPGGTFVNGVRAAAMPLTHGASIRIGATELRFLRG